MNEHYYNRYINFINSRNGRNISGIIHNHHIIPRCIGGTDDKSNLIKLTLREHYIAHLLLAKSYNDPKLVYAWNMLRSQAKTSRNFESLVNEWLKELSQSHKGKASIQNKETRQSYFEDVDIAKELVNSGIYKYCGSGFVVCKVNGITIAVPKEEYNKNIHDHINNRMFSVYDTRDNTNKKVDMDEYISNKQYYKTNLDNIVYIRVNNTIRGIDKSEYNKNIHDHINANTVVVRDGSNIKRISQDDYKTGHYSSIKKNMVNVYFEDGTSGEITKEEFKTNRSKYKIHNEGLVTCIEIETGKVVQVKKDLYYQYKNIKYRHINSGMILICPYCGKAGGITMKRWHFDNCKHKGDK